ncbi:S1C family serine protease [Vagococcus intermedius]|uniref:Trypsin-like peptidase domain-containing protein n=1 Tax=Vagococcus intermedius TaxID=2991418 RepID=A0AAF0CVD9_9ENTE|nr:trypsin-like peptidase domain-containing protein [Vagococcus intermedius]WEG73566.1 trypsin-like peptidase domain-containing protein [Vagococcus intermedius]WEG75648.1 trypsin-like peptidase domain-containing protein [Vagococcus intermedius]
MKKDVTPHTKQTGERKRFLTGLLGGIIGGLVTVGVAFTFFNPMPSNDKPVSSSKEDKQETNVSSIKYDVDSNVSKAVENVQEAVVSVVNLQKKEQLNDFSRFFGAKENEESHTTNDELEASSEGSGVIYRKDKDHSYIVTNNHVVDGSDALQVLLNDGTKIDAKLVGKDSYTDLAVLEVPSEKVKKAAEFGDSDKLKVGEPAIAIGSPLGSVYANSATLGIISAKDRKITNENESGQPVNINALQTDAAINPGNSGGPLINIAGQVIGINSIKIAQATSGVSAEGMGFSIPSNDVVSIISQLEKDGEVNRPMLGITMSDLAMISKEQQENILKLPNDVKNGVIVRSLQFASPAEKAGLKQYDVIVAIDGKEIESGTDLQSILYKKKVGETVELTYYREKEKKTTTVELTLDQASALKQQQKE